MKKLIIVILLVSVYANALSYSRDIAPLKTFNDRQKSKNSDIYLKLFSLQLEIKNLKKRLIKIEKVQKIYHDK